MPSKDIFDDIITALKNEAERNPLAYVSPEAVRELLTDIDLPSPKRASVIEAPPVSAPAERRAPPPPRAPFPAPAVPPPVITGPVPASAENCSWEELEAMVAACSRCGLSQSRKNTVFGSGNRSAELMFIGEAPGFDEDVQGLPFVGEAGQLLTKMITAMGFDRKEVFIANILKCRPPGNRTPLPDEMAVCIPVLKRQIQLVNPKVIVLLGSTALKGIYNPKMGITSARGKWIECMGVQTMPTYHPSYLLRNPAAKKDVWSDLQQVMKVFGKAPPQKRG
jgi:DNA polymerase